jgi:hypothetical protein
MNGKPRTVRGADLREKMIRSQEIGEQERATHQGQDLLKEDHSHGGVLTGKAKQQNLHQAKKNVWARIMRGKR